MKSLAQRKVGITYLATVFIYFAFTLYTAHHTLYLQDLVLVSAVFSILALSLDLVAGITGLYSLGHAGLFAIGAYSTTILNGKYGWNIFETLPVLVIYTSVFHYLVCI